MSATLNWSCSACGNIFSALVEYQQAYCPFCHALWNLEGARERWIDETGTYPDGQSLDDADETFGDQLGLNTIDTTDIQQMMAVATESLTWRKRTLLEWFNGVDIIGQQLERKAAASETVRQMVQQRTSLLSDIRQMMTAATDLAEAQFESRCRFLRMRVEALRLESERLRLEDEITQARALGPARLQTRRLEEAGNYERMRVKLLPPPPPEDPEAQVYEAITTERKRLRAKSSGRQAVIDDFLTELDEAYRSRGSRTERAAKVHAVMEAYGQEVDDLPPRIRKFLARSEASQYE